MLNTLRTAIGRDTDFAPRVAELGLMRAVLEGTIYDCLTHEFHQERSDDGKYIPIAKRRPSVRYNLCRLLVEDSVSLLFGEGRFPTIGCTDAKAAQVLDDVIEETGLSQVMQDAAFQGSVGSIAVLMLVLNERLFFDVMDTTFLTPEWDPKAPDTLLRVTEQYKVRGSVLAGLGYAIADQDMGVTFWFRRVWDANAETWFQPWKVVTDKPVTPEIDEAQTVQHILGFVPIAWIKNLPGSSAIDGGCTFRPAVENQIEIDYQLSQAGRGLKYSSDPTLLIKEPAGEEGAPIARTASEALVVDSGGDAKLLEISGTASQAVIEYVKVLREFALESIHGNRSSADKVTAAQSGRALEMLHQPLIWLADKLRTSYGNRGLLPLIQMVVAARRKMSLKVYGEPMPEFPDNLRLRLVWPPWFHMTERDKTEQTNRIAAAYDKGLISQEQAVTMLADSNGVSDVKAELTKIAADTAAKDTRATALGAQTKASEMLPA